MSGEEIARCSMCGRFARQTSSGCDEGGSETVTLECIRHGSWTEGY